jgi:AmmeMemoRadiSam system protein A
MCSDETANHYSQDEQQILLDISRQSIAYGLEYGRALPVDTEDFPARLREYRATFVTLLINSELRGCIGMLEATRPLVTDVAQNAFAAAFSDPRFPPLSREEFPELQIHISILTPPVPVEFTSEQDLIAKLQPGVDGLILEEGRYRGTFLPSVWESLPNPNAFLSHLKLKAGLPPNYWSDTIQVQRYTTMSIKELKS